MGKKYERRPISAPGFETRDAVDSHGSTSGTLSAYGHSVITATATGLVYQLPVPFAGAQKFVSIDYTGATGNLTLANASTTTVFDGSTANIITAASSEEHLSLLLFGLSTSKWATIASTGNGIAFAGSTVTS
jgi:hypothetical protein